MPGTAALDPPGYGVLLMGPDELREGERLLAVDYRPCDLPKAPGGEDLQSEDLAQLDRWVSAYAKCVEYTQSVLGLPSLPGPVPVPHVTTNSMVR